VAATFIPNELVNCELAVSTALSTSPASNRTVAFIRAFHAAANTTEADSTANSVTEIFGADNIRPNTTLTDYFEHALHNSSAACFHHCDAVPHCAGATSMGEQCYLHAYGFNSSERVGATAYVKAEVSRVDNATDEWLAKRYFLNGHVTEGVQEVRNRSCMLTLVPVECFEKCSLLKDCHAATFLTRMRSSRASGNCCFTVTNDLLLSIHNAKIDMLPPALQMVKNSNAILFVKKPLIELN
jgi:hypothetical protein